MTRPQVKWVLLYPTERAWRFSVGEIPEAIACGALQETPAYAPFEDAKRELLGLLDQGWDVPGRLVWKRTDKGWGADVEAEDS